MQISGRDGMIQRMGERAKSSTSPPEQVAPSSRLDRFLDLWAGRSAKMTMIAFNLATIALIVGFVGAAFGWIHWSPGFVGAFGKPAAVVGRNAVKRFTVP
ncbi:hypothetical protein [Phenylobacterium sp.]|uniref:hypothetical protein n=1 Tax=Phenylobacterium sp. TaxID=1871053 RepID=UPI002DF24BF4|nr:hypothetical protein [Phenylobacterium sp.]